MCGGELGRHVERREPTSRNDPNVGVVGADEPIAGTARHDSFQSSDLDMLVKPNRADNAFGREGAIASLDPATPEQVVLHRPFAIVVSDCPVP